MNASVREGQPSFAADLRDSQDPFKPAPISGRKRGLP